MPTLRAMTRLRNEAASGDVNLMPAIMQAVAAYATIGEMCNALRAVYGEYREPACRLTIGWGAARHPL